MDNPTPETNTPQPELHADSAPELTPELNRQTAQMVEPTSVEPADSPAPIKLPPAPEPRRDDVLVINQTTLYMFLTAIVFFAAGFIVAWLTFQTRAEDIRNTASSAAKDGVKTAIAELSGNAPTPTPLPRQDVKIEPSMPSWGPADAKVTVVEFSDLQCPFCEAFYQRTYQQLKTEYGDKIHFVFRHFPIASLHPNAEIASYAAECAKEQGRFWEFHNIVLGGSGSDLARDSLIQHARTAQVPDIDQFTKCLDTQKYKSVVDADIQAGDSYFVTGTPTFFINGNILVGAQSYQVFKTRIDQELQSVGG